MARTEQEILAGVAEILHDVCGIEPARSTVDKAFVDDLDVDSLSMYEIGMTTQDRFGVELPDEDMRGLRTVGDLVDYIRMAGVSA
ncbi:acyl carrier protein [Streptomyces olivochromogenes]|uniref:acyl carrier protein n=1 Tax=Streptomyces olivochromogenes TaxID=1963 RepID=UPI001F1678F3|nr:acyl carrier protein [Streptomyces olivochromogenes]MCF3131691.1 acyl carrier protein [Streptomyces olivochromogenes]